jgi:hypothetical protein
VSWVLLMAYCNEGVMGLWLDGMVGGGVWIGVRWTGTVAGLLG